ncbi:MAG TPA: M15 family metallopeptidase [Lachnospiraceae bacterium]|nr:M15 family metallopeptidase [Lachnospiraceae bacterium]
MGREISALHPDLQVLIKRLQSTCLKKGLIIGISECVRTVAEQNALYAQGRTKRGPIVTNAKGSTYSSMHQWGIAFDFYRNDGKGSYNDSDGFFTKVGKIGEAIGLEWGGSWTSIIDKPHFQLPDWGSTTAKLKEQYKSPENFILTWVDSSTTITKNTRPTRVMELQKALNKIPVNLPKLTIDGDYGEETQKYLLAVWNEWSWNKDGKSDGQYAGLRTLNKLGLL